MGNREFAHMKQKTKIDDSTLKGYVWFYHENPWMSMEKPRWAPYTDLETAIIEEEYQKPNRSERVSLTHYWIDLITFLQISKLDPGKQRKIKRELVDKHQQLLKSNRKIDELLNLTRKCEGVSSNIVSIHDTSSVIDYSKMLLAW